tara:strand:- start:9659 stop:10582 length:924 start_codon:yes stop_codon:yes gene_type:complete
MNNQETSENRNESVDPEVQAERELETILDDPANAFLEAHPQNMAKINNAETAVEALAIAEGLILERLERTFKFDLVREVEGVETISVNLKGIKKVIDSIKENQRVIGEGGDAFVVIDKNEIRELPPEVCYKFAKEEKTPRGRSTMSQEADIHGEFYQAAGELEGSNISVPMPFYSTEIAQDKMLAMEKLPAKSIDDILRGMGSLPDWLDIDDFCEQLGEFLDAMHERGLYHRDMHVGNVMISQSEEPPEDGRHGFVIDFGLSGYGVQGMDPYKKEVAGSTFTYNQDHAIINPIRRQLNDYRVRNRKV